MYKKLLIPLFSMLLVSLPVFAQNWGRLLKSGVGLVQSWTVTDDMVKEYVGQFIASSDKQNTVAAPGSAYANRLNNIVKGLTSVDGQRLNFKVYITKDINAFACADGSVRVYSGLMDVMSDDEVLGVIGHEIGHVAHHDTKNAMKKALQTSAMREAIGGMGGTLGALTDSQLGALGESVVNAKYSQKQETNADNYAYDFLKKHGKNPMVLALAFKKLKSLDSGQRSSLAQSLFSSHPDMEKRIKNVESKGKKDGYSYAGLKSSSSSTSSKSSSSNSKNNWKSKHSSSGK